VPVHDVAGRIGDDPVVLLRTETATVRRTTWCPVISVVAPRLSE
jgi:hypothetical protein